MAHQSQLHDVPEEMSDELAVMIEPTAGGVHAALRAQAEPGATVAVLGAGTMGLVTIAALRHLTEAGTIVCGARSPPSENWPESRLLSAAYPLDRYRATP